MTRTLEISAALSLPLRAVTEKLGFLGRTGSGKTYAAQKLAETMHAADAQFIVLDGVGVWYGLRLAADGKAPGLPIPVLGGLHGDIPLEPGAGALIANLVVDRGVSMVLDVSQFESDADKARFAQAFADRFFFRKKAAPSAVHLFLEECQEFVPQNPQREEARMLHAFTRLVKIGRNFGIGVSLISQRPQEVNKKVLNLTELLFAFQLTGPQERKTLQGWIAEKGIDEDIAGELPKLAVGHAHVWSPAWLKVSKVVAIARKTTYDASSTPTVGAKASTRALAPIDLERLRVDMTATIEKAKAEDPRELRRRIATLEAELKQRVKGVLVKAEPTPKRVQVPVLKDAQVKRFEGAIGRVIASNERTMSVTVELTKTGQALMAEIREAQRAWNAGLHALPSGVKSPEPGQIVDVPPGYTIGSVLYGRDPDRSPRDRTPREIARDELAAEIWGMGPRANDKDPRSDAGALPKGEAAVLTAIAQHYESGCSREQLSVLTGYKRSSRDTYLLRLTAAGLVQYHHEGHALATKAGLAALGPDFEPLPTGAALREHWLRDLPAGERAVLEVVLGAYPKAIERDTISDRTGYRRSSRDTYLQRLKTRKLIYDEGRGAVKASPTLF